ncbi:MAG: tRNA preQ1(34) S-adenosylmethionine ribosyltransferase-isomerase QueA [Gemmatales bacterium]|nr:tRNA preQ1(34) S-adenosylmethionine ribosyltransferase-isomerase QueA [Gemmatales bacterium]
MSPPQDSAASLPLEWFDYELPEELIAQEPLPERDQARLFVLYRHRGTWEHRHVYDLPELLRPGDLVVLNNTKVIPARLYGVRAKTSGRWEGLFLRRLTTGQWELLAQTRGKPQPGEELIVYPNATAPEAQPLRLTFEGKTDEGHWLCRPQSEMLPEQLLAIYGHVPLPPYIRQGRDRPEDRERYQTIYAERPGSVAAPTAGLHFTPRLLERLAQRQIGIAFVTLHVGVGTFQPIQVADAAQHRMHCEWCEIPPETAQRIVQCREQGGRVVAVGTTTVRTLETVAQTGPIRPWCGETDLFIRPPFTFRAVDILMTNFHLPRSSLLVLVSAFAGLDLIKQAYAEAVRQRYRFYSYGDAMLII